MAILDIHQVSLSFGGLQALQNVHLKIEKRQHPRSHRA